KYLNRACHEVPGFEALLIRFQRNISILGRSPKTFENYARHVAAMALHFKSLPTELDREQVKDYLYLLQQRSQTPSQSYFKHTVYGLRFLLKTEGLPYEHLHLPQIAKSTKLPTVLSKQEVWQMLQAAPLLKHRLLIGLIYGCGLRCHEACQLELKHLDFDRQQLHVVQSKGNKDRILPLSAHLIRGIKSYIQIHHPKQYLFEGTSGMHGDDLDSRYSNRGVQWVMKTVAKKAGILKDVHTHTLRHSYATHLLDDGMSILTLKELLGHACIETTMEYLHLAQLDNQKPFSPLDTLFATCAGQ
ncbi:MAG: tyrosine-type recombinase/integrase, partial [Oscillospiraceae bacterium]